MMNKIFGSLSTCLVGFFVVVGMLGCKEGPAGPAGKDASIGALEGYAPGIQCATCHSADSDTTYRVVAREVQYATSEHAVGGDFARNTYDCAGCHTNEGFYDRYNRGFANETFNINAPSVEICTQGYPNATPPGCFTCHAPHQRGNFTVRDSGAVNIFTLVAGQATQIWNSSAASNLCAKCHQPRMTSTFMWTSGTTPASWQPDPSKINTTDTAKIYTSRWNNHVSGEPTQTLLGTGGFEFAGYSNYQSSYHTTLINNKALGCEDCHMATVNSGDQNGGHTFWVRYLATGSTSPSYNVNGCNVSGCHTGLTASASDAHWGERATIIGETAQLAKMLMDTSVTNKWSQKSKIPWVTVTAGTIVGDSTYGVNATGSKPLIIAPAYKAGAIWNLQQIQYEKSHGIHNYKYVKALLDNSIAELSN
ncbi:MAG: hypothetical protein ABSA44_02855 [Bacteroidota bacterium]|jgi:hypothetical protein